MLFKILEIRLKLPILVNILKAFYTCTSAAFSGCRQGGVESPVLFNIYLDFVLRCSEHKVLQKYPNTGLQYSYAEACLRMILYAEDIIILCNDIDELTDILSIYDKTFSRFVLKISIGKTETMGFNISEQMKAKESLISIGEVALKNVRAFKYLGYMIANNEKDP